MSLRCAGGAAEQRDIPLRVLKRIDRPTGMAKMDLVDGDKKHLEFHGNAMEEIELSTEDMEFVKGFDIVYAERWAKAERYIAALRQPGQIWVYDFSKRLEQPSNDALLPYLDYAFFSYDKDDDYIREFMRRTKAKGAGCVIACWASMEALPTMDRDSIIRRRKTCRW